MTPNNASTLNHSELQTLLADYRDLRGAERAAVDEHLRTCAACTARLTEYRAMDRDLADLRDARPDARLRTGYLAAIQPANLPPSNLQPATARRLPLLPGLAGAVAVLALVFGVLFVLRPGEPEPQRGAAQPTLPAAKSAEVGAFVEQTDGAYGYRMLRPAGWVVSEDIEQRAYLLAPGQDPDLGLRATNLIARASLQPDSGEQDDIAARFAQVPDPADWADSVDEMWGQHYSPPLTKIVEQPNAVIYMQPFDPPSSLGVTIVALKVVDGQPMILTLGASGSVYPDLETLRERGIWDDFLTMLASLQPIPADPANIVPPLPTVFESRPLIPTPAPVTITTTVDAPRDPETTQVTLDIYSGLPNPAWTLTAEQTQELRALLDGLPEAACEPVNLGLGLRGFVVELGQRPELSNEYRLRVAGRQVRWGDPWNSDMPAFCQSDVEATVARFLLASGQEHMPEGVYALVEQDIQQAGAVPGDLLAYTDETFGFAFAHPMNWEGPENTAQSRLFYLKQDEPTGPAFPVFYVTVVPEGYTNADFEAYNFWSAEEVAAAVALEPGTSGPVHGAEGYNIYTRLPDVTTAAGLTGAVLESERVWEGGPDTRDRRVLLTHDGTLYMLGTYYTTPEELQVFEQVVRTFEVGE